ncbi:MAG: S41 family peptidase, partial [Nitrospira sp.]|nr:S41 family peptidase [Nitrospira sp.]
VSPALAAQSESPEEKARKLLERIERRSERAWDIAFSLRSMAEGENGEKLLPVIEEGLESENEYVRLVCARLEISLGKPKLAFEALKGLLASRDSAVLEPTAMLIADEGPEDEELVDILRETWEDSDGLAPGARVALCEALYSCAAEELAVSRLLEFAGSGERALANRAALALFDLGRAEDVALRVRSLSRENGELARLARLGGEIGRIRTAIKEFKEGAATRKEPLNDHFVDEEFYHNNHAYDVNSTNLVDHACRAMCAGVDRYSTYMTLEEIRRMQEDQEGRYVGIGAHVNEDEDGITYVSQPIYAGPAYKAGIRTGDKLVGVLDEEGNRIDLTKLDLESAVKHVRGPEGSTVTLFVKRRSVERELKFEIKRATIAVDTALEEMLPGKVGYVRLTRFGANSDEDMEESLEKLRLAGMKSLVLDLRGNPGGQLDAVLRIADLFLKAGAEISHSKGRYGDWKGTSEPFRAQNSGAGGRKFHKYTDLPMVVLIDDNSASGSEMLSGALKDNKRALLIGKPSFGKGIGQAFFNVPKSNNRRFLKCTVFSYYLPSGISIDRYAGEGGVVPDIDLDPVFLEPWEVYAIDALRKSEKMEDYLDLHYRGEDKPMLMNLALFDGRETAPWPKFDEFYEGLGTRLAKEHVRRELRYRLRARVQDDRGAEFTQNYQEDRVLLRGVRELFRKTGQDPATVPEYKKVIDRQD